MRLDERTKVKKWFCSKCGRESSGSEHEHPDGIRYPAMRLEMAQPEQRIEWMDLEHWQADEEGHRID